MHPVTIFDLFHTIKRRAVFIVVVALICGGAAFGYESLKETQTFAQRYTAEATLYATAYEYTPEEGEYNYSLDTTLFFNNVRKIILSDAVAGQVRREFAASDDSLVITAPFIFDSEIGQRMQSNYISVDVQSSDPQIALDATNRCVELATEQLKDLIPIVEVRIYEQAYLRTGDGTRVANAGVEKTGDNQEEKAPIATSSSSPLRSTALALLIGLFGSAFVFCLYEVIDKRIRAARDVEALCGCPVISTIPRQKGYGDEKAQKAVAQVANSIQVNLAKSNSKYLVVAGLGKKDEVGGFVETLTEAFSEIGLKTVVANTGESQLMSRENWVAEIKSLSAKSDLVLADGGILSDDARSPVVLSGASNATCLLVTAVAAASTREIDRSVKQLETTEVPVLGMALIDTRK
jgi:capsular polysaccharide biosynthesis protein